MPPPARSADAFGSCTFKMYAILRDYEYIIRRTKGGGGGHGPPVPPSPGSATELTAQATCMTNVSCAIVIDDQADQVSSANDFTCNGVQK